MQLQQIPLFNIDTEIFEKHKKNTENSKNSRIIFNHDTD